MVRPEAFPCSLVRETFSPLSLLRTVLWPCPAVDSVHPDRFLAMRIAVVHQGALGDFLLACPVFEGIHRALPQALLDIWTKGEHAGLLAARPYLGRIFSPDGGELTCFYHDELWSCADAPEAFQKSDYVLIFGQSRARIFSERLCRRMNVPVHWIQSFPHPENPIPVTEFLIEQICEKLFCIDRVPFRLLPEPEDLSVAQSWLAGKTGFEGSKAVVIHPGSGGFRKIWPLRRWWALIRWLRESLEIPVVLTLGPADDRLAGFARESERLGVHVAEGFSLSVLAALLSDARCFAGGDSGVSHLAAAVGIPTLVIFGVSDRRVWAPSGEAVSVVEDHWDDADIFEWSSTDGGDSRMAGCAQAVLEKWV